MQFLAHMIISLVAAVLGMLFNVFILIVLLWNRKIRTANSLLLLHMALVDVMHCLLLLAYSPALNTIDENDHSGHWLCTGHGFLWSLFPTVVVWTVCGLSCDRYAAISQPLRYSNFINTRRALFFVFFIWMLAAANALPPAAGICSYTFREARWACAPQCSQEVLQVVYLTISVCVSVLFPLSIVLSCNVHVFLIARYHRHRIVSAIYEVTLRAQATVTHQSNPPCYITKYRNSKNALSSITRNVGTLLLVVVPYFAVLFWETIWGTPSNRTVVSISSILFSCGPTLHAYVYGVKSRFLKQTLKRILERHVFKRQATREVERRLSLLSTRSHRVSAPRRLSFMNNGHAFVDKTLGNHLDTHMGATTPTFPVTEII